MGNPRHCSCGAVLVRHCESSPACPWFKCIVHRPPMIYDFDHGTRLVDGVTLEPIAG